jgi:hypothetical protein
VRQKIQRVERLATEEASVECHVFERRVWVPQQEIKTGMQVELPHDRQHALVVLELLISAELDESLGRSRLDAQEHAEEPHLLEPRKDVVVDLVGSSLDGETDAADTGPFQGFRDTVQAIQARAGTSKKKVVVMEIEDPDTVLVQGGHLSRDFFRIAHPQPRSPGESLPGRNRTEMARVSAASGRKEVDDGNSEDTLIGELAHRPWERVEVLRFASLGISMNVTSGIAPHETLNRREFASPFREVAQDLFALSDGDGIEGENVAQQTLRVEGGEVAARGEMATKTDVTESRRELRELARTAGKYD